jgi:hypothetical protein
MAASIWLEWTAGSSKGQWRRRASPGNTGQDSAASSQTVITVSTSRDTKSDAGLGRASPRSIPASCITATVSGCTASAGRLPAEATA